MSCANTAFPQSFPPNIKRKGPITTRKLFSSLEGIFIYSTVTFQGSCSCACSGSCSGAGFAQAAASPVDPDVQREAGSRKAGQKIGKRKATRPSLKPPFELEALQSYSIQAGHQHLPAECHARPGPGGRRALRCPRACRRRGARGAGREC